MISAFKSSGFYLHACWDFKHPFAVKRWTRNDYLGMFKLLKLLGMSRVMLWPTTEAVPGPISDADRSDLTSFRQIIADAQQHGLEAWLVFCANVTAEPSIRAKPLFQRHLYPFMTIVRLDDEAARTEYFKHRAEIFGILNNADAYVTIDGDPGGYPYADPADFAEVFRFDRTTLDRVGTHPDRQKLVPWIWAGWGNDWPSTAPGRSP